MSRIFVSGKEQSRKDACVWTVLFVVLCGLSIAYFQRASQPLRMLFDSQDYLSMADSLAAGRPAIHDGLPVGYPAVVFAMRKIGFGDHLAATNIAGLCAMLSLFCAIGRNFLGLSAIECACIATWSAVSRIVFTLATVAQPEMIFTCLSFATIISLETAVRRHRARWVVPAILCTVGAIACRSVGMALIPPVVAACWMSMDGRLAARVGASLAAGAVCAAAFWQFVHFHAYAVSCAGAVYSAVGLPRTILETADYRWEEATELLTNLPYHTTWPAAVRPGLFTFGLAFVALAIAGLWKHRSSMVAMYVIGYFGVLLVYPWYMPRFWVPVAPLVAAFAWIGLKTLASRLEWPRFTRGAFVSSYCAAFVAIGAYSFIVFGV